MVRIRTTRLPWSKYGPDAGSFGCGSHDARSQEPVDPHAGVHGLHVPEAADEKRGCGQQDEGDGDLENDQRIADPRANAVLRRCGPAAFSRSMTSARADCSAGARPTSSPATSDSHEREQEDAAIDADVGDARQAVRHEPEQQVDAPEARKEAGRAADERQDGAFDEQAR